MEERVNSYGLLLLSVSFLLLLLSPYLLSYGMFFDGITYSAVSRNLAIGFGSLWKPAYSLTLGREFYGHPPVGFWIQSVVYRLFGEALWLDKAYTLFIGAVNLALFYTLYGFLRRRGDPGFWAPLFLLSTFYAYRWVVRNNLLENTMSVFVLLSVIMYVLALRKGSLYGIPAGLSVLTAFLVKGPVGTFPLIAPLLLPVDARRDRRLKVLIIGLLVFTVSFLMLLSLPEVRHFFSQYLQRQIVGSISGRENSVPTRLYIVYALLTEILFPLVFLLPLLLFHIVRGDRNALNWNKRTFLLLLLALSGSLPIVLSLKQARFYLYPSLFFYSLFLVSLFRSPLKMFESRRLVKRLSFPLSVTLLTLSAFVSLKFAGTGMGGYVPFYRDFVENPLRLNLKKHEYLSICPKGLYGNWSMFAGMERAFKLSMALGDGSKYLLVDRIECKQVPEGYTPIHEGERFVLYRKVRP